MLTADLPIHPFTFSQLADCAERELNMRRHVYPNRIMTNRMSRQMADAELDKMRTIAGLLRALEKSERLL